MQPKSNNTNVRLQDRFAWEWRRIRRILRKGEREQLISSFERYNNDLASFVHNNEILAPHSTGREKGFVKYLDLVRNQACGLHSILGNSWKCNCNAPHTAYLRLQHPSEASPSPPAFSVTFPSRQMSIASSEAYGQELGFWNHTFISISKVDNQPEISSTEISSSVPLSTPRPPISEIRVELSSSLKATTREIKTSRVRFSATTTNMISSTSTTMFLDPLAGINQYPHFKVYLEKLILRSPSTSGYRLIMQRALKHTRWENSRPFPQCY